MTGLKIKHFGGGGPIFMCGRYTLKTPKAALELTFDQEINVDYQPRYNIASSQEVMVIIKDGPGDRHWDRLRWGLIPSWAKDKTIAQKLINARSESVLKKPSFRDAVRKRRCLVVADGFYEWKTLSTGVKQPFYFTLPSGEPFAFAGLWELWISTESGATIRTCNILTRHANASVLPIHHRMPVILEPSEYETWLSDRTSIDKLETIWKKEELIELSVSPVSRFVNSAANDSFLCIEPIEIGTFV